jgi:phage tail sheath protein FI
MPQYLAPGVYVEEVSFRASSIEGVGTSVAGIVGPTRFGPVSGMPEVVTSFAEFSRIYGDVADLRFGDDDVLNHTAIAAKAFFDGGGKQLFVSRVANSPVASARSQGGVAFAARFPGAMGDFTLEFDWRDEARTHCDITVRSGGADGPPIYTYGSVSTDPTARNSLARVLAVNPDKRADQLASPVSCTLADGVDATAVGTALDALYDEDALNPPAGSVDGPRRLIALQGGGDGDMPVASHYAGQVNPVTGSSGFAALEDVEDIAIVMAPSATALNETGHRAVVVEMQRHCRKMLYRVGIVDARDHMSISEVRAFRANFDDSRLAMYHPWVVIADPRRIADTIEVPPAGFIAGVYASTDVRRGVHKAPANETVIGALGFNQEINRFQQELLNPDGINCLRSFPGRGHRVWGGRTLSSDPEWKYLNVRRYFLYLQRSIDKSTQWVVFEPNGERLWANMRTTVEDFLYNEWFSGRLLGSSPKQAYFVRCDRSTMTQNDLDNGRLVCEIGVAPLKPAEFVIFRIGQKTADA